MTYTLDGTTIKRKYCETPLKLDSRLDYEVQITQNSGNLAVVMPPTLVTGSIITVPQNSIKAVAIDKVIIVELLWQSLKEALDSIQIRQKSGLDHSWVSILENPDLTTLAKQLQTDNPEERVDQAKISNQLTTLGVILINPDKHVLQQDYEVMIEFIDADQKILHGKSFTVEV